MQEILKQLLSDFPCEDENVYFFPKTSNKKVANKLTNAKKSYANFSDDEEVYILCDNTVFGNAKDGFILTSKALYSNRIVKDGITPLEIYSFGKIKLMGTDVFDDKKNKLGVLDFTAIDKEAAGTILHILTMYSMILRLVSPMLNQGVPSERLVIKAIEKLKESSTQDLTLSFDDFPGVEFINLATAQTRSSDQSVEIKAPNSSSQSSHDKNSAKKGHTEVNYIGLSKRLLAYFMDASIIFVLSGIILAIFAYFLSFKGEDSMLPIMQAVSLLYFTLMESSSRQATFGKTQMRIKVVNSKAERLSLLNALGRNLGKYLSLVLFGMGFFMIPFTKKKQALHDILAKTYVVKIEDYEEYAQEQKQKISSKMFALFGFALLGFLIVMALVSMLTSQVAKDIGNFLALVLGGIIWAGIFFAIYLANNSSAGQGVISAFSKIGDAFDRSEQGKPREEEKEKGPQAQEKDTKTPEKDPDKKVGEIKLITPELLNFTNKYWSIKKIDGKYFINTGLGNRDLYADDLDAIKEKAREYFLRWDGVSDVEIKIY